MSETVDEIRAEIRELLDVPEYMAGSTGFRSATIERALEEIGGTPWGGAPSLRKEIRRTIDDLDEGRGGKSFRKAELQTIRDALQEAEDDG